MCPFLTDLDTRAEVKGSRDPLGLQAIWTRIGRHVIGNLTTVTSSVRDFTTLLLGYHFAAAGPPETALSVFLKWEQLAAYARRVVNRDASFRGRDRVKANLSKSSRVKLSAAREHQILADQKTYGLWALYTTPSRTSGLVEVAAVRERCAVPGRAPPERVPLDRAW